MRGDFKLVSDAVRTDMIHRVTVLDNGSLRISNVTKMDDGVYTCVARNQFGVASSAGSLLVKGKLYLMTRLFWLIQVFFFSRVAAKDVVYNLERGCQQSDLWKIPDRATTVMPLSYFSLLMNKEAEIKKKGLLPETHAVQLVDWEWLQEARRKADCIYVPLCLIHTLL